VKITLKSIVTKSAVFVTSHIHYVFIISYQGGSISIYFETRLYPKLPSELVFAQRVLKKYSWVVCLTA
jgi:predicted Zn-dependent protease